MKEGVACAGSLLWILEAPIHKDYDGYSVYTDAANFPHQPQQPYPVPPLPPCAPAGPVRSLLFCCL